MTWFRRFVVPYILPFVVPLVLVAMLVMTIAATGNAQASALSIAAGVVAASPFVIQFVKAVFHLELDGRRMVVVSSIIALAIAVVALYLTGNLDTSDPVRLAETIAAAFGLQQLVFQAFKDGKLGPYLK